MGSVTSRVAVIDMVFADVCGSYFGSNILIPTLLLYFISGCTDTLPAYVCADEKRYGQCVYEDVMVDCCATCGEGNQCNQHYLTPH